VHTQRWTQGPVVVHLTLWNDIPVTGMPERTREIEVEPTRDGLWMAGAIGRVRLAKIADAVVRVDIEGHAYPEFAAAMQPILDGIVREHGHVYLGVDAEGMSSYDARFRYLFTEWLKANDGAIDGMLVLFRSRVVESAAVIINAVTGGELVTACDDREWFEDRLAGAASGTWTAVS
jgi:hypothetical protein